MGYQCSQWTSCYQTQTKSKYYGFNFQTSGSDRRICPSGEFPELEIHKILHKKVVDRIAQGWEYLNKKEYSKVEELLSAIFSEYEKDGEALFLDAKLF